MLLSMTQGEGSASINSAINVPTFSRGRHSQPHSAGVRSLNALFMAAGFSGHEPKAEIENANGFDAPTAHAHPQVHSIARMPSPRPGSWQTAERECIGAALLRREGLSYSAARWT